MTEKVLITGGSGFIGSHLGTEIANRGHPIVNVDINPPKDPDQQKFWVRCDVKERNKLAVVFDDFQPTRVIHLAAKANLIGKTVGDFPDNTLGTENVVECVNDTDSMRLLVNTSTQYVVKPGIHPVSSDYLQPYTAYGESKAVAEQIVRDKCIRSWSIVRPTNIWGPGHQFFPYELWRYLELRYYVHPGFKPIRKYYGYIDNAVQQILHVALTENPADVAGKIWYIADEPIDNADWMNGFSMGLSGKPLRRIPLALWRTMAFVGDLLNYCGLKFPVNGDRLFRLTVNESLPEEMIIRLPKGDVVSVQDGIMRSIEWYLRLKTQGERNGTP